MERLKEKFRKFMVGRYGSDQLGRFLVWGVLALIILNLFIHSKLLYWLELAGIVWCYYRMFSKNFSAREKENRAYMRIQLKAVNLKDKWKFRCQQARQYHIYKCPNCGQKIRIPRGKGRISIHCPKCGTDFIKKS